MNFGDRLMDPFAVVPGTGYYGVAEQGVLSVIAVDLADCALVVL